MGDKTSMLSATESGHSCGTGGWCLSLARRQPDRPLPAL